MRKSTSFISLLCLLFSASIVNAQQPPFDVQIVSGTINMFHLSYVEGTFEFSGPGVEIDGTLQNGDGDVQPACAPCFAGQTVTVYGHLFSLGYGYTTINGSGMNLYYSYNLNLQSVQFDLPYFRSWYPRTFNFPATLTGSIKGYTQNPNTNPTVPVFEAPLQLQGTVGLTLGLIGSPLNPNSYSVTGRPFYSTRGVFYQFTSAAVAPGWSPLQWLRKRVMTPLGRQNGNIADAVARTNQPNIRR